MRFDTVDVALCTAKQTVRVDVETAPVFTGTLSTVTNPTDGKDYFQAFIGDTDTEEFAVGVYIWAVELYCASSVPPLRREIQCKLKVVGQAVLG